MGSRMQLFFDGVNLSFYDGGVKVGSWVAISSTPGTPAYGPNFQASKEVYHIENRSDGSYIVPDVFGGPTPEGRYRLDLALTDTNSGLHQMPYDAGWGGMKWLLHPFAGTDTKGRDQMYVHGGASPGSNGCIDLGPNGSAILRAIYDYAKLNHMSAQWIDIQVNYAEWRASIASGGEHPALSPEWLEIVPPVLKGDLLRCFPAHTPIQTSLTSTTPISDLRIGDVVLAFDPHTDNGRGALVPRRVTKLFSNVTTEWVNLSWIEAGVSRELVATPGHHFLDQFGHFPPIEQMIRDGRASVVLACGSVVEVAATRIAYSAATAHLFERASSVAISAGNEALAAHALDAWTTYNFEVEDLHTYVAGAVNHNISIRRNAA
jgi:hypothetical protein